MFPAIHRPFVHPRRPRGGRAHVCKMALPIALNPTTIHYPQQIASDDQHLGTSFGSDKSTSGSVFRWAHSVSARRWCRHSCPDRRPNCSANGDPLALPAPASLSSPWPSPPAFQALAIRQVDPARQGQLQDVLASAVSLASIIGPLAFSTFYFAFQKQWPGAIWLSVVVIYAIAVPLIFLGTRTARATQPASVTCA
jgi:hypothetical protein